MNLSISINPLSYYQYLTQNRFRKYITKRGREYKRIIEDILSIFMIDKKVITGDCSVTLEFYHNNKRKNDVDNFAKPILDFMSDIIYVDDKQVIELHIYKKYDKENPRIVIKIVVK